MSPVTATPQDTSAYVLKSGDTMTGALTLPGDPVSSLQAATKNYVDSSTAAVQGGLAQKVSTVPSATQVVTQPSGTQLQVNILNGELYAKGYQTQGNSTGITTALTGPDCASGCTVVADPTYGGSDRFSLQTSRSSLVDQRGGAVDENFYNPQSPYQGYQTGRSMTITTTTSASAQVAAGKGTLQSEGLTVSEQALAGGNNLYPLNVTSNLPYFKSTYGASQTSGYSTTEGQHVLDTHVQNCYGIGDCLVGSEFVLSSGGFRDNSDEGTHPQRPGGRRTLHRVSWNVRLGLQHRIDATADHRNQRCRYPGRRSLPDQQDSRQDHHRRYPDRREQRLAACLCAVQRNRLFGQHVLHAGKRSGAAGDQHGSGNSLGSHCDQRRACGVLHQHRRCTGGVWRCLPCRCELRWRGQLRDRDL